MSDRSLVWSVIESFGTPLIEWPGGAAVLNAKEASYSLCLAAIAEGLNHFRLQLIDKSNQVVIDIYLDQDHAFTSGHCGAEILSARSAAEKLALYMPEFRLKQADWEFYEEDPGEENDDA